MSYCERAADLTSGRVTVPGGPLAALIRPNEAGKYAGTAKART